MKRWIGRLGLGVGLSLIAFCFSAGASEVRGIGLVAIGDIPAPLMERLRAFAEFNTAIPVRIRPALPYGGQSLYQEGEAVAQSKAEADVALVALVDGDFSFTEHAVYRYTDGVALVNVREMRVDAPDEEIFARRLEKLTMRSIGLLLDVEPVPNPFSAMWSYQTKEDLDMMGRNYDPPSLLQVQRKAMRRGIRLLEDTPFNMMSPEEMVDGESEGAHD